MKRLLITVIFVTMFIGVEAQGPWKGFFRPIDRSPYKSIGIDRALNDWKVRPLVQLTAMQFLLTSPVTVSSLSSLGTGISYQNIIEQNDKPYTRFAVNGLMLFTTTGEQSPASLSFAVTGSFWQYISIGAGYSLQEKKFFVLTGVQYSFN